MEKSSVESGGVATELYLFLFCICYVYKKSVYRTVCIKKSQKNIRYDNSVSD